MKRVQKSKDIIAEITDFANLQQSIKKVIRGSKRKKSFSGKKILNNKDYYINKLIKEISSGSFKISHYKEMTVVDCGKERKIQSIRLYERIGLNAIINVVEKRIHSSYINTSAASIKNRGTHYLKRCIENDIAKDPEGTKYCYKFDIRKFYESIDQNIMMICLRKFFKDRALLTILERCVKMMPTGLSIGLRSSQTFGNMILSTYLDHILKDKLGVKYYYRYCDDGVVLAGDKKELWHIRDLIHKCINGINLEIKNNERVFPTSKGIDFLGYVIYDNNYARLRKRNKQNAARKLHKIKDIKRKNVVISSFYSICKHANCRNLFKTITGKDMNEFKDLGIKPKYSDNKKHFSGMNISVRELVNMPIIVLDFETGIIPRFEQEEYEKRLANANTAENIPKPKGRYVVKVSVDGVERKFFTASKEMWSVLDQIKALGKLPFRTTIKSEQYGKKGETKYIFT